MVKLTSLPAHQSWLTVNPLLSGMTSNLSSRCSRGPGPRVRALSAKVLLCLRYFTTLHYLLCSIVQLRVFFWLNLSSNFISWCLQNWKIRAPSLLTFLMRHKNTYLHTEDFQVASFYNASNHNWCIMMQINCCLRLATLLK